MDRLQLAIWQSTLDSALSIPVVLIKNARQAGVPIHNRGIYVTIFACTNCAGYISTSTNSHTGTITAALIGVLGEVTSRPMLTKTKPSTAGGVFVLMRELSFWNGVGSTSQSLGDSHTTRGLVEQFVYGGLIANVGDVLAGRCMANQWGVGKTMKWATSQRFRNFITVYSSSITSRIICSESMQVESQ